MPDFRAMAERLGTLAKPVVWLNDVFKGPEFRWAHVEFFSIPDYIAVLHVCVFPTLRVQKPIFGFDVIAGSRKATGAFLDLSPTTSSANAIIEKWAVQADKDRASFEDHRVLPEWAATIFSPHALAIRPSSTSEVDQILGLARASLMMTLDQAFETGAPTMMVAAQRVYVEGQRKNEHTFRMLANCVGPDLAREFIDGWLFPQSEDGDDDESLAASKGYAAH